MLCNECKTKKYTKIIIGVTEWYLCDDCHKEYKRKKNDNKRTK